MTSQYLARLAADAEPGALRRLARYMGIAGAYVWSDSTLATEMQWHLTPWDASMYRQ